LIERISDDLFLRKKDHGDLLYSLFLDDGVKMPGRSSRFACGILVDKTGADMKKALLDKNKEIRELQEENLDDDPSALLLWKLLNYEEVSLPSVDAAVVQFPYTGGITSILLLQYRVRNLNMYIVCKLMFLI
jgi:hypothetical protein